MSFWNDSMFFSTSEEKIKKLAENFHDHLLQCMERVQPLIGLKDYMYKTQMLTWLLEQRPINYRHVVVVARAIKSDTELSDDRLKSYDFDHSLFYDLFSLPLRIALTPLKFLAALCTKPSQSYLVLKICVEEILRLISAIVFPFALFYSKYKTDSFNVSKGVASRMLDSLIVLADKLTTTKDCDETKSVSRSFEEEPVTITVNKDQLLLTKNPDPYQDRLQRPGTVNWAFSSSRY
jgi:hypothetical protein